MCLLVTRGCRPATQEFKRSANHCQCHANTRGVQASAYRPGTRTCALGANVSVLFAHAYDPHTHNFVLIVVAEGGWPHGFQPCAWRYEPGVRVFESLARVFELCACCFGSTARRYERDVAVGGLDTRVSGVLAYSYEPDTSASL
jgi:hypothetical protein